MRRALPWIALVIILAGVVVAVAIPSIPIHHLVPSRSLSLPTRETDDRLWLRFGILAGALLLALLFGYLAGRREPGRR